MILTVVLFFLLNGRGHHPLAQAPPTLRRLEGTKRTNFYVRGSTRAYIKSREKGINIDLSPSEVSVHVTDASRPPHSFDLMVVMKPLSQLEYSRPALAETSTLWQVAPSYS